MKAFLDKLHMPRWLEIFLLIVFLFRIPSFFEPYHYGDEMIYMTLGEGVRQGVSLYSGLYDNKPPLLYLVAAASGSLFWFKAILTFWVLITIVFFWKLIKYWVPDNENLQKVAVFVFGILTTIPLLEGNIVNAELFMIGPTIIAFYLLLTKKNSLKNMFTAGIFLGISALFKIPAIFDVPMILLFWIISENLSLKNITTSIKKMAVVALGLLTPIALSFVWFYFNGGLKDYISDAFLQNLPYLSSWREGSMEGGSILDSLPILIRGGVVLAGVTLLYLSRKKLSKSFIFFGIWILLSLFGATLSERPYPHYLIQAVAPISFFVGLLLTNKTIEQSLAIIPLFIAAFVPFYYKYWHYPTMPYYARFVSFIVGGTTKSEYLNSFSPTVERNYKLSEFISSSLSERERVFVWSNDSPTIYALSRRLPPIKYVADYHVLDYSSKSEILGELIKTTPKFIVLTNGAPAFPELGVYLRGSYLLINKIDDAEVWSLLASKGE